jgi:hypothetical protein
VNIARIPEYFEFGARAIEDQGIASTAMILFDVNTLPTVAETLKHCTYEIAQMQFVKPAIGAAYRKLFAGRVLPPSSDAAKSFSVARTRAASPERIKLGIDPERLAGFDGFEMIIPLLQSGPDKAQLRTPFRQSRPSSAERDVEQNLAGGPVYRCSGSNAAGELVDSLSMKRAKWLRTRALRHGISLRLKDS